MNIYLGGRVRERAGGVEVAGRAHHALDDVSCYAHAPGEAERLLLVGQQLAQVAALQQLCDQPEVVLLEAGAQKANDVRVIDLADSEAPSAAAAQAARTTRYLLMATSCLNFSSCSGVRSCTLGIFTATCCSISGTTDPNATE